MKLDIGHHNVVTSAEFDTISFGAGNLAVLFKILRHKMYSDPIMVICQEVMSNARDAHREVNTPDKPIRVTLPSNLSPCLEIQDFGPGITPNRMTDVVSKYGESTKRGSNLETGGYGLGFKTPFAYVETFTIVTTTCHDGEYIRREYQAYIDKTGIGAISCLKEESGDPSEQGTTIIVPVKEKDFSLFTKAVYDVGIFWKVRPEITAPDFEWPKLKYHYEGFDGKWKILDLRTPVDDSLDILRTGTKTLKPSVVIDGIQYPLRLEKIYDDGKVISEQVQKIARKCLKLFFNVGELEVTSNREDLDYTDNVKKRIRYVLHKAKAELLKKSREKLEGAGSLFEAVILWNEIKGSDLMFVENKWKGMNLQRSFNFRCRDVHTYQYEMNKYGKVERTGRHRYYYGTGKYNKHLDVVISPKILLVEDDTDQKAVSVPRVATLFDRHKNIDKVFVVKFCGDGSDRAIKLEKELKERHNWNDLNPIMLSTIPKKKMIRKRSGTVKISKIKMATKKSHYSGRGQRHEWKPAEVDLANGSGFFVVLKGRDAFWGDPSNDEIYNIDWHVDVAEFFDQPVYGIFERWIPKIGPNWINLKDHVYKTLTSLRSDKTIKAAMKTDPTWVAASALPRSIYRGLEKHCHTFLETSVARRYFEDSMINQAAEKKIDRLNRLERIVGVEVTPRQVDKTMDKMYKGFKKAYPLVPMGTRPLDLKWSEIEFYIRAKDDEAARLAEETRIEEEKKQQEKIAAIAEVAVAAYKGDDQ